MQAQARRRTEMGWLLADGLPQDPKEFEYSMVYPNEQGRRAMVLHADTLSDAVSGFVFVDHQPSEWVWVPDYQKRNRSSATGTVDMFVAPGESASLRVVLAIGEPAASASAAHKQKAMDAMTRRLDDYAANFEQHFAGAKTGWQKVWEDAFTPPAQRAEPKDKQLFSGHLPVLATPDLAVHRLYYMGCLSLLNTGRTSLAAFSEGHHGLSSFITGFGNTCWTRGNLHPSEVECLKPSYARDTLLQPVYIGGSAQFYWDTSLRALLTTLLDPKAMRRYILSFLSLHGRRFERSFGLDALTGGPIGYEYAFNSYSIFTIITTYVRATNDTALMAEKVAGDDQGGKAATVGQRLEEVALDWLRRRVPKPATSNGTVIQPNMSIWPFSSGRTTEPHGNETAAAGKTKKTEEEEDDGLFYLADYGGNGNTFLECVPTYVHVVPALQAANAEMMGVLAKLRKAQGNATGAAYFRGLVTRITADMTEHLYLKGGEGVWSCLYPADYSLVPVRHIVDFIYISRGLEAAAREGGDGLQGLPVEVSGAMNNFFHDELETKSWTRALSPYDKLNLKVPRPRSILRPDHGITGAFDAWAALAVEAVAINDGSWDKALTVLRHMAAVTSEGPFGQAHEITEMDQSAFKTKRGFTRHGADNGASFSEVILRGLFGYHPSFCATVDASLPYKGLEHALLRPEQSRSDFVGTLDGLQTPWGVASLEVGAQGVHIKEVVVAK